jgi:hypothetical protein
MAAHVKKSMLSQILTDSIDLMLFLQELKVNGFKLGSSANFV